MVLKVPSVFFQLVTICRHHCDDRDEPPLPSKLALKKKKSTRQEEFPKGVYFLCKCVSSDWKGETAFIPLLTHRRRRGTKRKLRMVSMAPINILIKIYIKVREQP